MAEYATSIEIDAGPADVFDYLVTEAGMTAWMGEYATLDPRTGGEFSVNIAGHRIRGEYIEIDRPHRVVVSWGMAGSSDLPPGKSTVTFMLTPIARGTRVDLVHSDLPDKQMPGHAAGWSHFLPRLQSAAVGIDPGKDSWVPI